MSFYKLSLYLNPLVRACYHIFVAILTWKIPQDFGQLRRWSVNVRSVNKCSVGIHLFPSSKFNFIANSWTSCKVDASRRFVWLYRKTWWLKLCCFVNTPEMIKLRFSTLNTVGFRWHEYRYRYWTNFYLFLRHFSASSLSGAKVKSWSINWPHCIVKWDWLLVLCLDG